MNRIAQSTSPTASTIQHVQPKTESPIESQMNRLDNSLTMLENNIDNLVGRLLPLLGSDPRVPTECSNKHPQACEFEGRLGGMNDRLSDHIGLIARIRENLCL